MTMNLSDNNQQKKLSTIYRVLSAVICVVTLIGSVVAFIGVTVLPFEIGDLLALLTMLFWLHLTGKIAITGYAPKYLRFSSSESNKI